MKYYTELERAAVIRGDRSHGSQSSGKFAGARTFQGSLGPSKGTLVIPYRVWLEGSASLAA